MSHERATSEEDGPEEGLPFPDTDLSPALQRTIRRRLDEEGDEGAPSEARFLRTLREVTRPDEDSPEEPPAE